MAKAEFRAHFDHLVRLISPFHSCGYAEILANDLILTRLSSETIVIASCAVTCASAFAAMQIEILANDLDFDETGFRAHCDGLVCLIFPFHVCGNAGALANGLIFMCF